MCALDPSGAHAIRWKMPSAILMAMALMASIGLVHSVPIQSFATFPNEDGKIAFSSERDGNREIYLMNADGSGQTRLTNTPTANEDFVNWSPDGKKLVYSTPAICIMDLSVVPGKEACFSKISGFEPVWSPDGNKILYRALVNGVRTFHIVNSDGTNDTMLNLFISTKINSPDWSPDGKQIVFTSPIGTYIANADGSSVHLLANAGNSDPSWSPDGHKIVFKNSGDLFSINVDGSGLTLLSNTGLDSFPNWSPDGTKIVFNRQASLTSSLIQIYIMNSDGSGVAKLSTGSNVDLFPDFGPKSSALAQSQSQLYVISSQKNEVLRYNGTTGKFIGAFVSSGSGGLDTPEDLTFGPDGNLYISSAKTDQILRYNGNDGAFIDVFVSAGSGGLHAPSSIAFGPDGNLYVASYNTNEVLRYNGTSGAFIDKFASAKIGDPALFTGLALAFGPDGNLYVGVSQRFREFSQGSIEKFNGTTGEFINEFKALGTNVNPIDMVFGQSGDLYIAASQNQLIHLDRNGNEVSGFGGNSTLDGAMGITIGSDGNFYVSSYSSDEILRFDGKDRSFKNTFVTAASGGLSGPTRLVFSSQNQQQEHRGLTVESIDLSGKSVNGVWTVIRAASDGSIVKTGFTPVTFNGDSTTQYKISMANYDGKIFQHWQDNNSTSNSRIVSLSADSVFTAVYDIGHSLRGFTPLSYHGKADQPDLTIKAITIEANKTLHMWAIIDPVSSTKSPNGTATYKVYATNGYKDLVFDHWGDNGSKERMRTLTIDRTTMMAAYYRTTPIFPPPQSLKVAFKYDDCHLSVTGCGIGSINCSGGEPSSTLAPITPVFNFVASENPSAVIQGNWTAIVPGAASAFLDFGNLTSLSSADGTNFLIQGSWQGMEGGGNTVDHSVAICDGKMIDGATVTFPGQCGGTEVRFETTNGVKAIVQGKTSCTAS